MTPILSANHVSTRFDTTSGGVQAVNDVSLTLGRQEILGVVGESGSGKSVLLKSLVGLAPGRPGVTSGEVHYNFSDGEHRPFEGIERAKLGTRRWRATLERRFDGLRGKKVGLVLQNGRAALDPLWTVGKQLDAAIDDDTTANMWLERMGFEDPSAVAGKYPHELSGGMAQRAMLAIVLARRPEILLLDEITTGLDVSLQAAVLTLLKRLHDDLPFSAIIVTHDLGIARTISGRVMIMKSGKVVQTASTQALFDREVELAPYTAQLLASGSADHARPVAGEAPAGAAVTASGLQKRFETTNWLRALTGTRGSVTAIAGVSLDLKPGECVAIVGESGSGKTTLARLLVDLLEADAGKIDRGGLDTQILFQNPYTSLNPKMTAVAAVAESLRMHSPMDSAEARSEADRLLSKAGLHGKQRQTLETLSGGERRRVGLLRSMASSAGFVVLDEPSSGLDAVYRADVVEMITEARRRDPQRIFCVVSHDLGFVAGVADRVLVLYRGRVVEECSVDRLVERGAEHHPYTQLLLESSRVVAGLDADEKIFGASSKPTTTNGGCVFVDRCWRYGLQSRLTECETQEPALLALQDGGSVACHEVHRADA